MNNKHVELEMNGDERRPPFSSENEAAARANNVSEHIAPPREVLDGSKLYGEEEILHFPFNGIGGLDAVSGLQSSQKSVHPSPASELSDSKKKIQSKWLPSTKMTNWSEEDEKMLEEFFYPPMKAGESRGQGSSKNGAGHSSASSSIPRLVQPLEEYNVGSGDVFHHIDNTFATGAFNWTGYPGGPMNSFGHPGFSNHFDHTSAIQTSNRPNGLTSATGGFIDVVSSSGFSGINYTVGLTNSISQPGPDRNHQKSSVIPSRTNNVAPKMMSGEPSNVCKKRFTREGVDVMTLPLMDGTEIHTQNLGLRMRYELSKRNIALTKFSEGVLGMGDSYMSNLLASKDPWEKLSEPRKVSWLKIKKWFEMSTKKEEGSS